MDYVSKKLRAFRSSRIRSKYNKARVMPEPSCKSTPTDSPRSRYTASSAIIDRVILSRALAVKFEDELSVSEFSANEFVQGCLHWHNHFRRRHGVPDLSLSYQLCSMAQFWANHLAHNNTFYHRKFRDIGENLFCKWSNDPEFDITGQQMSKYWYDEMKLYNFQLDPSTLHVNAGHFSQMVWRSSTQFGVGKARTRCGKVIVVANYKPAGNVIGEFLENVYPPLASCEDNDDVTSYEDDDEDHDLLESMRYLERYRDNHQTSTGQ